jgi:hypothetical protein
MRRGHNDDGLVNRVMKVGGVLLLASVGVLLVARFSAIRRYYGMRRMSARTHPKPPGTQTPGTAAPPRWGTTHWPLG